MLDEPTVRLPAVMDGRNRRALSSLRVKLVDQDRLVGFRGPAYGLVVRVQPLHPVRLGQDQRDKRPHALLTIRGVDVIRLAGQPEKRGPVHRPAGEEAGGGLGGVRRVDLQGAKELLRRAGAAENLLLQNQA